MCTEDTKSKIVDIIMARDGSDEQTARRAIALTQNQVDEAMDNGMAMDDAEEIIKSNLGLDGAYLLDFV